MSRRASVPGGEQVASGCGHGPLVVDGRVGVVDVLVETSAGDAGCEVPGRERAAEPGEQAVDVSGPEAVRVTGASDVERELVVERFGCVVGGDRWWAWSSSKGGCLAESAGEPWLSREATRRLSVRLPTLMGWN